jgi:hypothetical protein
MTAPDRIAHTLIKNSCQPGASTYDNAFPPGKARRLGSNGITRQSTAVGLMAESELTVLASQCLDRRIPDFYK